MLFHDHVSDMSAKLLIDNREVPQVITYGYLAFKIILADDPVNFAVKTLQVRITELVKKCEIINDLFKSVTGNKTQNRSHYEIDLIKFFGT